MNDLENELLYSRLLDTAPDAMVVVGEDSRIKFVNVQAENLLISTCRA